jgi:hypothetical protein
MNIHRRVVSHQESATAAELRPPPRGLELLFVIFILAGMILIAIGFGSLVAEMPRGSVPDARMAFPQTGVFVPS